MQNQNLLIRFRAVMRHHAARFATIIATIIIVLSIFALILDSVYADNTSGQQLYNQNCAACHGTEGSGGVGVPLALKSFQENVSDDYLFKTIRYGRPGRVMPAFTRLNDRQVKSIVRHLRQLANSKAIQLSDKTIKGDPKLGQQLFKKHCAVCHGENGQGGKGTGVTFSRPRNLAIIPPALNNIGFLKSASDIMIKQTTLHGRQGTPMPAFAKRGLSEQDANNLVAYIRSFETPHTQQNKIEKPEPAFIKIKSNYSLEETMNNIKRAVGGANYRLIRTQYLDQGLAKKGNENKQQYIIYFCNFNQLNTALGIDPRIGMFLPCRITISQQGKDTYIYAINPKRLSSLFNNNELDRACEEMKKTYLTIIEEANL